MSEFKGTKGQWTVTASKEYSDSVYIVTENGAPTYGENEYNAQLIAHAPQMLEMLSTLMADFEDCGNEIEMADAFSSRMKGIKQLIKQATTIK